MGNKPDMNALLDTQFAAQSYQEYNDKQLDGNNVGAANALDRARHYLDRAMQEAGVDPKDPKQLEGALKVIGVPNNSTPAYPNGRTRQWEEDYFGAQTLAAQQLMDSVTYAKSPEAAVKALQGIKQYMANVGFDMDNSQGKNNSSAGFRLLNQGSGGEIDNNSFNKLMSEKQAAMSQSVQQTAPQAPKVQPSGAAQP